MDPLRAIGEDQEGQTSPSHNLHNPMKTDRESLDDFEHVVKDVPASHDQNLQFINFEKGQTEIAETVKEADRKLSPEKEQIGDTLDDFLVDIVKKPNPMAGFEQDALGSSKNFMQYEQGGPKDELEDFLKGPEKPEIVHDDSDQSQGEDDDSIVSPVRDQVKPDSPEPVKPITPEPILLKEVKPPIPEPEPVREEKPATPEPPKIKEPSLARPKAEPPKIPEHRPTAVEEVAPPAPVPRDYPEIGVLEPRDILNACGLYTLFHPDRLNPHVESLVYWRDPKKSGIVFGSVFVVLLSLTLFSLISVVAYTALGVLLAAISFRIYKSVLNATQKTSEGHPFNKYLLPALQNPLVQAVFQIIQEYLEVDLTLSPERAREVTDLAVSHVNSAITELRRRFLVENFVDSFKFGLLLYVLTYLGAWFNGLTLIILGFVALFTLPKVYENNQAQIDANLDLVRAKINEVTDKIKAVIPLGKKPEENKDKNE